MEVLDLLVLVKVGIDSDFIFLVFVVVFLISEIFMEFVFLVEEVYNGGKVLCC